MKATILSTTLVFALAGTFTATAQDDDGPPKAPRERRGPPPELLERFDKDGDGKLNETEREAARKAMEERRAEARARMLEKFDKDGDGKLDEDERKEARKAAINERKEMLEKYDTDKDGRLSPEERKAAIDAGEKIPPRPMRRPGARRGEGQGRRGPGGPEGRRGPGPRGPKPPPADDTPDA